MANVRLLVCLLTIGGIAGPALAQGGEEPLLVIVDGDVSAGPTAAEVRHAVAAELGTPVLSPRDAAGGPFSDVLLIAIERTEIRMSFGSRPMGAVSRTIVAPPERQARLHAIAWLAGNMARDQLAPIVMSPAPAVPPAAPVPVTAEAHPVPPTEPLPVASSDSPGHAVNAIETVSAAASSPRETGAAVWSITVAAGPSVTLWQRQDWRVPDSGTYGLEVQRLAPFGRYILGASLEGGPNIGLYGAHHEIGLAGFLGSGWQKGRALLELTAGAGIESLRGGSVTTTTLSSSEGVVVNRSVGDSSLALYARGQATVGLTLTSSWDLVGRVGLHISTAGLDASHASASLGVRFKLP